MTEPPKEPDARAKPSTEEILASIRSIVAEDRTPDGAAEGGGSGVLELTDSVDEHGNAIPLDGGSPSPAPPAPETARPRAPHGTGPDGATEGRPGAPGERTVEQLVEAMLRPMLREWLDAHLPEITRRMVQSEIERVARRPDPES